MTVFTYKDYRENETEEIAKLFQMLLKKNGFEKYPIYLFTHEGGIFCIISSNKIQKLILATSFKHKFDGFELELKNGRIDKTFDSGEGDTYGISFDFAHFEQFLREPDGKIN